MLEQSLQDARTVALFGGAQQSLDDCTRLWRQTARPFRLLHHPAQAIDMRIQYRVETGYGDTQPGDQAREFALRGGMTRLVTLKLTGELEIAFAPVCRFADH